MAAMAASATAIAAVTLVDAMAPVSPSSEAPLPTNKTVIASLESASFVAPVVFLPCRTEIWRTTATVTPTATANLDAARDRGLHTSASPSFSPERAVKRTRIANWSTVTDYFLKSEVCVGWRYDIICKRATYLYSLNHHPCRPIIDVVVVLYRSTLLENPFARPLRHQCPPCEWPGIFRDSH
jgi:hypothetical protein